MTRTPLQTHRWHPPRDLGRQGPFAPNALLASLELMPIPGSGAEDVAVDAEGRIYTGTREGYLLRLSPDGRHVERLAQTGGRPLGIELRPDGGLVVCDAHRGLLRVDPSSGDIEVLVSEVEGRQLMLTNNCSVAADGSIYFSESSQRFGLDEFKGDIIEHSATGRLLRRNPDGSVDILLTGLSFANGVALAEDESFVLVAETGAYSVVRLDLTGPSAGRRSLIIENLPGMPDNMSRGSDGVFWIALPSERNKLLDRLLPRHGALRKAIWAMPDRLQPDATRIAWVIGIDGEGAVVRNLQGPGTAFHYVTGVREHEGRLYLGSLVEPAVAVASL